MTIQPQELNQLLSLLTEGQLPVASSEAIASRMLLALEDPETYVSNHPDEEWLVEGCDLSANNKGSVRLLHWIVRHELDEWLVTGSKIMDVADQLIDRLHECGIVISDPPHPLRSLDECREHVVAVLVSLTNTPSSKTIIEIDFNDGVGLTGEGLLVVGASRAPQALAISERIGLRVKVW